MNKKEIIEWIKTIAVSVVIAFIITQFIQPTLVKGYSMYPTLNEYDYLILNKISHEPQKGDIVVFKSHLKTVDGKEKDLIKRVIGLEGDQIKITQGKVYVNGKMLKEPYINGDFTPGEIELVVPDHEIFAMGDNRGNSLDSRDPSVGPIDVSMIKGKVLVRLWPLNKIGSIS